jgi:hypothetical protein
LLQVCQFGVAEPDSPAQITRGCIEVVTESAHHRPAGMCTVENPVDDQAGAGVGGGIDMHVQSFVLRYLAGIVMIGIKHACAKLERLE